jgi:hypothetical protein
LERLYLEKNPSQKRAGGVAQGLSSNPVPQKKKKKSVGVRAQGAASQNCWGKSVPGMRERNFSPSN